MCQFKIELICSKNLLKRNKEMNHFSMNLSRKLNFHQVSGIVYLPSKANQATVYIPEIEADEDSEIGFRMNLKKLGV